MKIELVTGKEAKKLGFTHSRLLSEGHGAFGESENTYDDIVYVDNKVVRISDNDLILFRGKNRKVIQVISEWNCSDEILEIMNPEALIKRKKEKYVKYLELKKEIHSDKFYGVIK